MRPTAARGGGRRLVVRHTHAMAEHHDADGGRHLDQHLGQPQHGEIAAGLGRRLQPHHHPDTDAARQDHQQDGAGEAQPAPDQLSQQGLVQQVPPAQMWPQAGQHEGGGRRLRHGDRAKCHREVQATGRPGRQGQQQQHAARDQLGLIEVPQIAGAEKHALPHPHQQHRGYGEHGQRHRRRAGFFEATPGQHRPCGSTGQQSQQDPQGRHMAGDRTGTLRRLADQGGRTLAQAQIEGDRQHQRRRYDIAVEAELHGGQRAGQGHEHQQVGASLDQPCQQYPDGFAQHRR